MQPSQSKLLLNARVLGKGDAKCEIFRHLSPLTVGALMKKLPLQGRIHRFEDIFVYLTSGAIAGVEKARKKFQKGDIAFLSFNGAICFFQKGCTVAKSMNPLGTVSSGMEVLTKSLPGDILQIDAEPSENPSDS